MTLRRTPSDGHSAFRSLDELGHGDAGLVGAKAATLGELRRRGFAAPAGFVVTTEGFSRFLAHTGVNALVQRTLVRLAKASDRAIADASRELQAAVRSAPMPPAIAEALASHVKRLRASRLAVRSSAPFEDGHDQSWAGQFDSFLGVLPADVEERLRECWASLFNVRALTYRARSRVSHGHGDAAPSHGAMAVLIQRMVVAERAGVAFSIHPVTGVSSLLVIEAVHGLGESAVSGSVTPDTYTLHKDSLRLVGRSPHGQTDALRERQGVVEHVSLTDSERRGPVLDARELRKLGQVVADLERSFGAPVDVEWTLAKDEIEIVQCRPITTTATTSAAAAALTGPELSRMSWRYIHTRTRSPFFAHVFMGGIPECLNEIGLDYRVRHIGIFSGDVAMNRPEWDGLATRIRDLRARAPEWPLHAIRLCKEQHALARRRWRRLLATDFGSSRPTQMADALERYVDDGHRFNAFVVWPPVMEADLTREIQERLRQRFGDGAEAAFATASDPVESGVLLDEKIALLEIGRHPERKRQLALAAHSDRFGWMKNVGYFGDWYGPAHYAKLVRAAQTDRAPSATVADIRAGISAKKRALAALLHECGDDEGLAILVRIVNAAVAFRSYRAEMFYESYRYVRGLLDAIARRLRVSPKDVLYLFPDEILGLLRGGARRPPLDVIRARKDDYLWVSDRATTYFTLAGDDSRAAKPPFDRPQESLSTTSVVGQPAYPGVVSGRVIVVKNMSELHLVRSADVLVAHATNIDFVPILHKVAAIVTEEGGILCHAAVVSREMRIPAVIGTGNATRVFRTGDCVEVDGARGIVRRL